MAQSDLCQLPPATEAGCCDAPPAAPAAPLVIDNAPGLAAIEYRIGTFTTFRRAMLDRVADAGRPETASAASGPFANWREGADGDYQTVFIELWAYLADILTFYQERIANEAFIGTATQSDSARRLAELIAYTPAPGSGAGGLIALSVAKGKVVAVPQGFRVGRRAGPGQAAAVFETASPLTARAEHNAIHLSAVAPTNQFARLSSFARMFVEAGPLTLGLAQEMYFSAGGTLFRTLGGVRALPATVSISGARPTLLSTARTALIDVRPNIPISAIIGVPRPPIRYRPFVSLTTRTVVLDGVNTRLAAGNYVLAVENERTTEDDDPDSEQASLYQLSSVNTDKASNTTTISWQEPSGTTYQQSADKPVALYAMRVQASHFGSAAPNWYTLVQELKATDASAEISRAPYGNWDDPKNAATHIPAGPQLALDSIYDAASATSDNPGWVALVSGQSDGSAPHIARFLAARPIVLTDYARNARVTQLTLASNRPVPDGRFGIRDTLILTGAEKLVLQNDLPLPDPVQGDTLILAGLYPDLQDGQVAIISGNLFAASSAGSAGDPATEFRRLVGSPLQDAENGLTTVRLKDALQNQYIRSTTVLLANVVAVTQGETVADEVLGNGNGGALQMFPLKKQPLTYLPSTDPAGTATSTRRRASVSSVQSTLTVTVNGVQWQEQPNLFESGPSDQDFAVTQDETGASKVAFGDGTNGARPSTGANNIHARYRVGMGRSGNVPVAGIQQLVSNIAGLQQVTNPQPTVGGADPESLAAVRSNAPASLRAFDRAVSAEDYAALARTFPGVAKTSARRVVFGPDGAALAHPYIQLTAAATDGTPVSQGTVASQLRSFLDQRRDPNVALRILDFTAIYVDFAVTINLDDRVPRQATFARIQAALNTGRNPDGSAGYFSFDQLDFGESLHLSAIYAFIQNIPGVSDATVTTFRRMDQDRGDSTTVRNDILTGPTEIAVIGNDANHPERGLLAVVQGTGGFVDT